MGNTCSNTPTQSDSARVEEDNTSKKTSEVREQRMLHIPGAPNNWGIYYQVLKINSKHTVTIFVMKNKPQDAETVKPQYIAICFFKMEKSPSKIQFKKSENCGFSITAYTSEEKTSREIAVHSITWKSTEYTVREEDDGVFFEKCVKKIQRTDNPNLFVSSFKPTSLSVEDAFATGGGNASSASEDVSVNSATQRVPSVSIGSGAGVSTLPKNVPPPEAVGRSLVNPNKLFMFQKQYQQMFEQIMRQYEMLQQIMSRGKVDPHLCFPQCDSCINESAAANTRNVLRRTPVIKSDYRSVSDSISLWVIKRDDIDMCIKFLVNGVDVSLILTVPKEVIGVIAYMYRVNDQYVLGTVSRLINQYVAFLQLDCDPSKTSLVLSDAGCDNRHRFLLWICHQMRRIISRSCVDASSAVKDVNHSQEFERCGPVEESITGSKTVGTFSGTQYTFTVLPDSNKIVYNTKINWNSQHNVQFDIVNVFSLKVYELLTGVYLIVIQTKSGQTYLSGYLSTNATACFATCQITSNLEERRFQSFEHISGTVFKCIFSDGTERTFSIESGSYASINEVFHV